MSKKVSVIIPFYKGVKWLEDAVKSVLWQTYNNLEIIIINDGSPENMDDFLRAYGDKIIYRYQDNAGAAVARNHAIDISTGEYIAFLDSDDIWLPQKIEKQIAFMEKIGALWSHTGFYYWWPESGRLKLIPNANFYGDIYKKSYVAIKVATPSVVLSRKVFDEHPEIKFPINYRRGQDTYFYRELSKFYKIALIKAPLIKVRMRGNNTNTLAITRFNFNSKEYKRIRQQRIKISCMSVLIYYIYFVYAKIFGEKTNLVKEFIAKCFWVLPYSLERVYSIYLCIKIKKDKKYICKDVIFTMIE